MSTEPPTSTSNERPLPLDYTNAVDPAPTAWEWLVVWFIYIIVSVAGVVLIVFGSEMYVAHRRSEGKVYEIFGGIFLVRVAAISVVALALTFGGGRWLIKRWRAFR